MRALLLLCALGCGGLADSAQEVPRGWCCNDELAGTPVLLCGDSARSQQPATCHCAGIVTRSGECLDAHPYTPGTVCMGGERVCW